MTSSFKKNTSGTSPKIFFLKKGIKIMSLWEHSSFHQINVFDSVISNFDESVFSKGKSSKTLARELSSMRSTLLLFV